MKDENNASCESARPDPIRSAGFQLHVAVPAAGQFTTTPASFPAQNTPLSPEEWPVVSWHGESAATADVTPVWTVTPTQGSPASIHVPAKVKVMKNRKVKVVVHYVTGQYKLFSGTMESRAPTAKPTADVIKEKLRNVFSRQINTWFEDLVCRDEAVDWDAGKDSDWGTPQNPVTGSKIPEYNRSLDLGGWIDNPAPDRISVEEQKLLALRNPADKAVIDVFVIGGCWNMQTYAGTPEGVINDDFDPNNPNHPIVPRPGLTKRERRTIYLAGENVRRENTIPKELLLQVIAHEIGHVIIGPGHPDDLKDNGTHAGVAPLEGTNTLDRLMHSDEKAKKNADTLDRNLIVKGGGTRRRLG